MLCRLSTACFLSAALASFLGTDLPCQVQKKVFFSDADATRGGANTFPWSRKGLRYQLIFTAKQMGGRCVVNDILAAPQLAMRPTVKTGIYQDIEIRMGLTAQTVPTRNWNTNNPKPTTVYRGPMRITFEKGKFRGIGLPKSYNYNPTSIAANLCVEFIMWNMNTATNSNIRALTGGGTRAYYFLWTTRQTTPPSIGSSACKLGLICDNGNFVVTEQSCLSSKNTRLSIGANTFPQWGKPISITLSGALPLSSCILVLGLSDTKGFGGTLPLDAKFLGAPGCFLWNEPLVQAGAFALQSGSATLKFTLPPGSGEPRVYMHWWNFDKNANAAGVTTSNYAKVLLGK